MSCWPLCPMSNNPCNVLSWCSQNVCALYAQHEKQCLCMCACVYNGIGLCKTHTHCAVCVCILECGGKWLQIAQNAPRMPAILSQLHVHSSVRLSFKDTMLWCSVKYLVDSCSLPDYGFFNGTLFIVIDEIVSPVRFKRLLSYSMGNVQRPR